MTVGLLVPGGDRVPQRLDARHGGVLVGARPHVAGDGIHQAWVAVEVGKTLGQVYGAGFGRQLRHDREDGRADGRQP